MAQGLSPLVRGKRQHHDTNIYTRGSIPACAGETNSAICAWVSQTVYPRLCGGNMGEIHLASGLMGLSPLVRGKQSNKPTGKTGRGSIPACAGETTINLNETLSGWVYPRLCGGNMVSSFFIFRSSGLSPLVRGKRLRQR